MMLYVNLHRYFYYIIFKRCLVQNDSHVSYDWSIRVQEGTQYVKNELSVLERGCLSTSVSPPD